MDDIEKYQEAMKGVLRSSDGITMTVFFERVLRLMGEDGSAEQMAIDCGFDPDDLITEGINSRKMKVISNQRG